MFDFRISEIQVVDFRQVVTLLANVKYIRIVPYCTYRIASLFYKFDERRLNECTGMQNNKAFAENRAIESGVLKMLAIK